jgi:alpha/beta superfamily hydrolase
MGRRLRIGNGRTVRATLDVADGNDSRAVVACPPHPQFGGDRTDSRLRAVSDALGDRSVDCLRIDYGPWDGGRSEQTDVRDGLAWSRERYGSVGLFGYSFGAAVALLAAGGSGRTDVSGGTAGRSGREAGTGAGPASPDAVSVLAPASTVGDGLDAAGAVGGVGCPLQVLFGSRDETVDSGPVVERARDRGATVERLAADHHYVGQRATAAGLVADFLARNL